MLLMPVVHKWLTSVFLQSDRIRVYCLFYVVYMNLDEEATRRKRGKNVVLFSCLPPRFEGKHAPHFAALTRISISIGTLSLSPVKTAKSKLSRRRPCRMRKCSRSTQFCFFKTAPEGFYEPFGTSKEWVTNYPKDSHHFIFRHVNWRSLVRHCTHI